MRLAMASLIPSPGEEPGNEAIAMVSLIPSPGEEPGNEVSNG